MNSTEAAAMVSLERKSSIEKEPRTLNIQQIQLAREAALYVVRTRSVEEALRIFTAGLEPVMSCGHEEIKDEDYYDEEDDQEQLLLQYKYTYHNHHHNPMYINGLGRVAEERDIVSAPF